MSLASSIDSSATRIASDAIRSLPAVVRPAAQSASQAMGKMAADVSSLSDDALQKAMARIADLSSQNVQLASQDAADKASLASETAAYNQAVGEITQANTVIQGLNARVAPAEQKVASGTAEVQAFTSDWNEGMTALAQYANDANGWMQQANQMLQNAAAHITNLGQIFLK